jgi:hypothetical protein
MNYYIFYLKFIDYLKNINYNENSENLSIYLQIANPFFLEGIGSADYTLLDEFEITFNKFYVNEKYTDENAFFFIIYYIKKYEKYSLNNILSINIDSWNLFLEEQ